MHGTKIAWCDSAFLLLPFLLNRLNSAVSNCWQVGFQINGICMDTGEKILFVAMTDTEDI